MHLRTRTSARMRERVPAWVIDNVRPIQHRFPGQSGGTPPRVRPCQTDEAWPRSLGAMSGGSLGVLGNFRDRRRQRRSQKKSPLPPGSIGDGSDVISSQYLPETALGGSAARSLCRPDDSPTLVLPSAQPLPHQNSHSNPNPHQPQPQPQHRRQNRQHLRQPQPHVYADTRTERQRSQHAKYSHRSRPLQRSGSHGAAPPPGPGRGVPTMSHSEMDLLAGVLSRERNSRGRAHPDMVAPESRPYRGGSLAGRKGLDAASTRQANLPWANRRMSIEAVSGGRRSDDAVCPPQLHDRYVWDRERGSTEDDGGGRRRPGRAPCGKSNGQWPQTPAERSRTGPPGGRVQVSRRPRQGKDRGHGSDGGRGRRSHPHRSALDKPAASSGQQRRQQPRVVFEMAPGKASAVGHPASRPDGTESWKCGVCGLTNPPSSAVTCFCCGKGRERGAD